MTVEPSLARWSVLFQILTVPVAMSVRSAFVVSVQVAVVATLLAKFWFTVNTSWQIGLGCCL